MKHRIMVLAALIVIFAGLGLAAQTSKPALASKAADDGFVTIFDGKTLQGWHVSAKTQHGAGGRWVVENGPSSAARTGPGAAGLSSPTRSMATSKWSSK